MANDFMLAYREQLNQATLLPQPPPRVTESKLELTVLFTALPETLGALRKASELARGLDARIRLLVPQVVPYPLPLETPPVLLEFNQRRFHAIASAQVIETCVDIYLCRDIDVLLGEVLPCGSTVLIGGRKRWWPTSEELLARRLRRMGHQTILANDFLHAEEYRNA